MRPTLRSHADEEDTTVDPADEAVDNVYKIVVRVAFATLRSHRSGPDKAEAANHPHPEDDERNDRAVWIRVDDVDEAPKFTDDDSTRLIAENTDDLLPDIAINRLVVGTVEASDPEYGYAAGPQFGKKPNYSVDLPRGLQQPVPDSPVQRRHSDPRQAELRGLERVG